MTNELARYDAVGLAELVREKELSPLELIDDTIDRIERLNPQVTRFGAALLAQLVELGRVQHGASETIHLPDHYMIELCDTSTTSVAFDSRR